MVEREIIPIILCGGSGSRLWPLSRVARPKQFLKFGSEHSLLQDTVLRCSGDIFSAKPIVVSAQSQRFLIAEDFRNIGKDADILLEPLRRDSCAAIVAGCLRAMQRNADALVLILAADHEIPDHKAFQKAVAAAAMDASGGHLVTFGIQPTYPATGFGYLKPGVDLRALGSQKLLQFVEKPNLQVAEKYIANGYLWNSGNFLFSAQVFIAEVAKFAPEILHAVRQSFDQAKIENDFTWLEEKGFAASSQISVDYAVMEKTDRAAVFKVDYAWSDIGSWDAVHANMPSDSNNNVIDGNCIVLNAANTLVRSSGILVGVVGVEDIIVVASDDAVLVTKRGNSEQVKDLVSELKKQNFKEAE